MMETIGFLGCGNMGGAIARAVCKAADPKKVYLANRTTAKAQALAKELAPSGIPVNAVACGMIDTSMNAFLDPDELSALTEEIPAGRAGTPEEAAALVRQVAEAPEYMTGQIITLDGGWI